MDSTRDEREFPLQLEDLEKKLEKWLSLCTAQIHVSIQMVMSPME
jgi:hypothetical protein